jgi:hypothetical protein
VNARTDAQTRLVESRSVECLLSVTPLPGFNGADDVRHAVRHRRVDSVLGDVALDAEVVTVRTHRLRQFVELIGCQVQLNGRLASKLSMW